VFIDISDPHDEIIYKYWEPGSGGAFASGLRALNAFSQRHSFFYGYFAARRRLNNERATSNFFPAEGSADARFWVQDLKAGWVSKVKRPSSLTVPVWSSIWLVNFIGLSRKPRPLGRGGMDA